MKSKILIKTLWIFMLGGLLATGFTACNNSNDTTQETPGDIDDPRDEGDPGNQSHGYGTSNGYDDDNDTLASDEDEIEHNHE